MSQPMTILQEAVVAALQAHPALSATLTGIYDGPEAQAAYPYIAIGDATVSDWSSKTELGREIRLPINIWDDGARASRIHDLSGHVADALAALPENLPGWQLVGNQFLRALVTRDVAGPWVALVEHRIRLFSV